MLIAGPFLSSRPCSVKWIVPKKRGVPSMHCLSEVSRAFRWQMPDPNSSSAVMKRWRDAISKGSAAPGSLTLRMCGDAATLRASKLQGCAIRSQWHRVSDGSADEANLALGIAYAGRQRTDWLIVSHARDLHPSGDPLAHLHSLHKAPFDAQEDATRT